MKGRNLPSNTLQLPAGYRSWLDYWQKKTGQKVNECGFLACAYEATTAMIVELQENPGVYYIMPECFSCSKFKHTELYDVKEKLLLEFVIEKP